MWQAVCWLQAVGRTMYLQAVRWQGVLGKGWGGAAAAGLGVLVVCQNECVTMC